MNKKLSYLSFCLLFISQLLWSQTNVLVTGSVTDAQGVGIADTPIYLISHQDSNLLSFVITDANGLYEINHVEDATQGCASVTAILCNGEIATQDICWNPAELEFDVSFTADCNTSNNCYVYITETVNSQNEIVLTAESPLGSLPINYLWSTGETTQSIVGEQGNTYCVDIIDADGCEANACVDVYGIDSCEVFFYTDFLENTLYAQGFGEGLITYTWTLDGEEISSDSTGILTITEEGEYCVEMEDEAGCTSMYCEYVVPDSVFNYCWGQIIVEEDSMGIYTLSVEAYDAGDNLTYLWSTGETTETIEVSEDGEYCVEVNDGEGCTFFVCTYVGSFNFCDVYFYYDPFVQSAIAFGYGEGEIDYSWTLDGVSLPDTSNEINVTMDGLYCVNMVDETGCEASYCEEVVIDTTIFNECYSYIYSEIDSSGTEILTTYTFGQGPFTYVWNNGQSTSQSIAVTTDTIYCVEVVDQNNCVSTACYEPFVWNDCSVFVSCDPSPNGIELVAIPYGQGPFTYLWSTGDTTESITVTESGEYCVTVEDQNGCISEWCQFVEVGGVDLCFFELEIIAETDSTTTIDVIVSDSTDFVYYLEGEEVQFPLELMNNNFYCIEAIDTLSGCVAVQCIDLFNHTNCAGSVEILLDSVAGTLTAIVTNGSGNYEYYWANGDSTATITFDASIPEYCVVVIDSDDGCVYTSCIDFGNTANDIMFITGFVYDAVDGFPLDGTATIYEAQDSVLSEVGIVDVLGGIFEIQLPCGEYIVRSDATDPIGVNEYIPTYAPSEEFWTDAQVIDCSMGEFILLDIAAIRTTGLVGPGGIEGFVFEGGNLTTDGASENRSNEPVEGADIVLFSDEMVPFAHVTSDGEGKFEVENLPYGKYKVYLATPGVKLQMKEVVLSPSNAFIDNITFNANTPTSTNEEELVNSNFTLLPNPAVDWIQVKGLDINDYQVEVFDQMGRKMVVRLQNDRIDVDHLSSGLYILSLKGSNNTVTKNFIKK